MRAGKEFSAWWPFAHLKSLIFNCNRGKGVPAVNYVSQHPMCWARAKSQIVPLTDENLAASFAGK